MPLSALMPAPVRITNFFIVWRVWFFAWQRYSFQLK